VRPLRVLAAVVLLGGVLAAWLGSRAPDERLPRDAPTGEPAGLSSAAPAELLAAPKPRVPHEAPPAFHRSAAPPPLGRSTESTPDVTTLHGRVIDEDGEGIGGAEVVSGVTVTMSYAGGPFDMVSKTTTTVADGSFSFDAMRWSTFVRALEGPSWSGSLPTPVTPASETLVLRVTRRRAIDGFVLDPAGVSAAATPVRAMYRDREGRAREVTAVASDDGQFVLRVPPEITVADLTCGLLEGQKGATTSPLGVEMPALPLPANRMVVRLVAAARIRGTTVSPTGEPVPAIHVVALGSERDFPSRPRVEAESDSAGQFMLAPLRPGRWTLVAVVRTASFTYTELQVQAPADGVTFRLDRASSLTGRVVGTDVAGFEVLWVSAAGPEGGRMGTVTVGVTGEFRVKGLPSAPVRLFARRIGDTRYAIEVGALPGPQEHTLALVEGQAIEGRSEGYDGRVIAHQGDLQHEGRAEGGSFRIRGLPPGRWTLRKVSHSDNMEWETGDGIPADTGATDVRIR
jgi:hypothetical protein